MQFKQFKFVKSLALFSLMITSLSFAQNKPNDIVYQQDNQVSTYHKTTPTQKEVTTQVKSLMEQQRNAKLSGNTASVMSIQRQIDDLTGESVSVSQNQVAGTIKFYGQPVGSLDNIINTRVFTSPSNSFIKSMCTATEQRGSNIGRIWLAFAYGTTTNTSPDTILIFYSDGGNSWTQYSGAIPGANSKINNDEMDMEIMEYTSGQKYVWTSLGLTDNTGKKYVDVLIYQTPTYAGGFYTLGWPGGATNVDVYRPRLTSDNANYPTSSSYLFLLAGRDTLSAANTHKIGEKLVQCQSPFTVSPTFVYKANAFGYDVQYGGTGTYYAGADHCDIAYFQNGGFDSLMIVESNLPDSTMIYCNKSDENAVSSVNFASLNSGGGSSVQKQYARIISNGGNRIMTAYRSNYTNSGDWDIRYSLSTNGGVTASAWANGYVDGFASTTTVPYQPDLAGLRGTSTFKCAYTYFNSGIDSAMIVSCPNGTTWGNTQRMSLTGIDVSISASPRAGYRYVSNDSCYLSWSQYQATNVLSATGCTGPQVVGIINSNTGIPKTFSLSQNYPNPFNPTTNIKFSIPKNSVVKLSIYDLTGRVVATLVDGQLNAGNYAYDFDASNIASGVYFYKLQSEDFSDVKKMMLIK